MALLLGVGSALAEDAALQDASPVHGTPLSPETALAAAFSSRYEVDLLANIELVTRSASGQELRRRFRAASKQIEGLVHSVGRLVWPEYLRGMTILTIEAQHRGHDAFVYMPSLDRVRRITTAQRGQSFFGTDVTYEDIERRRVEDYKLTDLTSGELQGEPVFVIRGQCLRDMNYSHVIFVVAQSDWAILETRYFKTGQQTPFRVISAPRSGMLSHDGHVLPTHMLVENRIRGTTTEVTFTDLQINPPIDDRLFTVTTLERDRKLPGGREWRPRTGLPREEIRTEPPDGSVGSPAPTASPHSPPKTTASDEPKTPADADPR